MTTIDYYNQNAEAFVQGTLHADMHAHYNRFLPYLPDHARILDLGCGSGRDTLFFLQKGYDVVPVDGSEEVCKEAERILGFAVRCLRFEELDYYNEFDGIWACASLLHVPKADILSIMNKVASALKANGVLYVSFKYGSGEEIKGERLFNYYKEDFMDSVLPQTGLVCREHWVSNDVRPDRQEEKWINIIAAKHFMM